MAKKVFLLADGEPLALGARKTLRKGRFTLVLDGAAEQARKERWLPDLISGDFDSVRPATLAYFSRKGVPLLHTPDQNHTDLEKALAWCTARGYTNIWVAQGLGRRLGHSLANLSLLKRFHRPCGELLFFTESETVRFLRDERIRLKGKAGRGFALMPFPFCRAGSKGLEYELGGEPYKLGERESVSNRARGSMVELSVDGEALVIEENR